MSTIDIILAVAALTFVSRVAGPAIMAFVTITPPIERLLDAMAVSVIAALTVSVLLQGGPREATAAGAALAVTLLTGKPLAAMLAAIAVGAVWTAFPL